MFLSHNIVFNNFVAPIRYGCYITFCLVTFVIFTMGLFQIIKVSLSINWFLIGFYTWVNISASGSGVFRYFNWPIKVSKTFCFFFLFILLKLMLKMLPKVAIIVMLYIMAFLTASSCSVTDCYLTFILILIMELCIQEKWMFVYGSSKMIVYIVLVSGKRLYLKQSNVNE